jgi:aryl-alcohol dehydrogenase-like predicted oxidoreductase
MRYRPLDRSGAAISCISLVLPDAPMGERERTKIVYAALESGVNAFEIQSADPEVAACVGRALSTIERQMVMVGLRLTWSRHARGPHQGAGAAGLGALIEQTLQRSGLGYLDSVMLGAPDSDPPTEEAIAVVENARGRGRAKMLGVAGEGTEALRHVESGVFDIMALRFNVHADNETRNRIRRAAAHGLAVFGYDRYPSRHSEPPPPPIVAAAKSFDLGKLFRGKTAAQVSPYAFLNATPGWTAEEISLAYALTEPTIASIQVDARSPAHMAKLAATVDKSLPTGMAAQIEMARISAAAQPQKVDKRRLRA